MSFRKNLSTCRRCPGFVILEESSCVLDDAPALSFWKNSIVLDDAPALSFWKNLPSCLTMPGLVILEESSIGLTMPRFCHSGRIFLRVEEVVRRWKILTG